MVANQLRWYLLLTGQDPKSVEKIMSADAQRIAQRCTAEGQPRCGKAATKDERLVRLLDLPP